jgi:phosphopantothenate---cysteine ligase (CTP)
MKIIITCGPSYEPIDGARRMTNMSTGKLGITLANALTDDGHEVICLKGEGATCPDPLRAASVRSFTTNEDMRISRTSFARSVRRSRRTPYCTRRRCAISRLRG